MFEIREMRIDDLSETISLWDKVKELNFNKKFDNEERLKRFLTRNENLSSIALDNDKIIGAILCGHDGRRGFVYHAGVLPEYRKKGVASKIVERSLSKLKEDEIDSCFLFTADYNELAKKFWKSQGFEYASFVMYHSKWIGND